jgi:hypothetical protein
MMENRGEVGESLGSQEIINTQRLEMFVWDSCVLDLELLGDGRTPYLSFTR